MEKTATLLTVTWSPSLVVLGPLSCPGALRIEDFPHFSVLLSSSTLQWTRTPTTGISTAWVWYVWSPYRVTPQNGEQRAASRNMASISEITFVGTSRTSTLWITLESASVRRWNSSTSAETWALISPLAFGRLRTATHCILTVLLLAVSSIQLLDRCQMKTTLASIRKSIQSSAAQRMLRRPHSGGLEDICKAQFNRTGWPLKSASMTVVIPVETHIPSWMNLGKRL